MFCLCARASYAITACAVALLQTGCATSITIPQGTLQLREVAHVLSRDEILSGSVRTTRDNRGREAIRWPELHDLLLRDGMPDSDMVDGSVIAGRTQFFWHNATSGIVRQYVRASTVAKGVQLSVGNIVEVEQRGELTRVIRVKYGSLAEGRCEYRRADRSTVGSALDAINPVGGPGAASLYCPYLEEEGWGPLRHVRGIEWFKPPLKAQ
jgi:hypothetical protein